MRLSNALLSVLAATDIDADASLPVVAGRTGMRVHQVRYALLRLKALHVIQGKHVLLDTFRLGLNLAAVLFSLSARRTSDREAALQAGLNSPDLAWFSELVGGYEFAAALLIRRVEALHDFWQRMRKGRQVTIAKRAVTMRTAFWVFPRRYLAPEAKAPAPIEVRGSADEPPKLDETDRKFLSAFVQQQWPDIRSLSQKLKLALPTAYRRMARLHELNLVRGYLWSIDLELLGVRRYRLLLSVRDAQAALLQKILRFAQSEPNVTNVVECIGPWDYELALEVQRLEELRGVVNRLYDTFGEQLLDLQSLAVNRYRRFTSYPLT